ncbi:6186_t:CDS:2 [Funneliformis geosporum]|uniref:9524_t:CDS:1 n=1 Tax=Funneliformis geosporum TaxID=1117311 RepID=A0A9W4SWI1_9GLOM|nr:6186_t:CDS:2 [Funneliformis geosporum]CAI2183958.1 9524_t:CDS:2 [Funneliformis geosporum]
MTLHWKDDPKLLKQICLVDIKTEPNPQWIMIICGNQENLLKAFAFYWRTFISDILVGFNDSDYNWCFIMKRAYHLNIIKWIGNTVKKIGENSKNALKAKNVIKYFEKSGEDLKKKKNMGDSIKIKISAEDDFTSSFLKLPVEKKSLLKFFLQKCGLDNKADMPYDKIRNALSGAIGIEKERSVTGLDFIPLYPSLIMTNNLSLEKFILSSKDADIAQKNGNTYMRLAFHSISVTSMLDAFTMIAK